jgi:3-hydroxyacyl-CoA dehydrogenase
MVRVYGPSAEGLAVQTVDVMDARTERNCGVFELADEVGGLDKLLEVVENLLESV